MATALRFGPVVRSLRTIIQAEDYGQLKCALPFRLSAFLLVKDHGELRCRSDKDFWLWNSAESVGMSASSIVVSEKTIQPNLL